MTDRIGQQFGNYRLTRLIGRGGFAEVYLAQHLRLISQQAAIKILTAHVHEDSYRAFVQEAETVASLVHPNIIKLIDFDVKDDTPFLVMSYIPNGSLRQRHPRGVQLPLPLVVEYVRQIASALQYAHGKKIIHRDVKPDNMLIGERNEIIVSDFGIATIAHSTLSQKIQPASGTIAYMAPEQIHKYPRPASDQYALAISVYEWLAGERPFTGTFNEIAAKHTLAEPPPLSEKRAALPPGVEQTIMTALAKDPYKRFASIEAFAYALEHASRFSLVTEPLWRNISIDQNKEVVVSLTRREQADEKPSAPLKQSQDLLHVKKVDTGLVSNDRKRGKRMTILFSFLILLIIVGVSLGGYAYLSFNGGVEAPSQLKSFFSTGRMSPTSRAAPSPTPGCEGAFSDDFSSGNLHRGWNWINPGEQATYMIIPRHFLTITTPGNSDLNPSTNTDAPRLLQSITGNFTVDTLVELPENQTGFQAAGLLLWQDGNDFLRVERYLYSFDFEQVIHGVLTHEASDSLASSTIEAEQAELQLQRVGDLFSASWRLPGQDWHNIATINVQFQQILVGLDLINESASLATANYDYFHVTCA